jgi:hypothetical protein
VLETEKREEEKDLARAANSQLSLAHRTVRWRTEQCPVHQAGFRRTSRSREILAAYDYKSPDCPVSQRPPAQRSVAQSAGDAWPAPTIGWGHRTVRCAPDSVWCANQPGVATVGCARTGRRSRTEHEQWLSGGAPDCPVRHPTEREMCPWAISKYFGD